MMYRYVYVQVYWHMCTWGTKKWGYELYRRGCVGCIGVTEDMGCIYVDMDMGCGLVVHSSLMTVLLRCHVCIYPMQNTYGNLKSILDIHIFVATIYSQDSTRDNIHYF